MSETTRTGGPAQWDDPAQTRAGFAVFVGRPNVGKSTLTNALVGEKIAITSNRPQTTRHTIRGIVHRDSGQLVLVDTPGVHRPRTLLGERLNELVSETLSEVDVLGICIPADEKIGPGDRFIAQQLASAGRKPIVAIITKADKVDRGELAEQLMAVEAMGREVLTAEHVEFQRRQAIRARKRGGDYTPTPVPEDIGFADVIPVSAVDSFKLEELAELLISHMPVSPPLYPDGDLTDEPEMTLVAELVREAALEGVRDELPHSLAAVCDDMIPREDRPEDDPMLDVHVSLYVERPSQKAIVIGKQGARLREIGATSRASIERLLGTRVYLSLHVKVAKEWQRDPRQMSRLGF
ncbi:GTPase Era [Kocuria palustris]|uniref:GTPase Era n=1 Tax=Kocuria palustris TaxID=71999 RepID=UPI002042CA0C|nr:GTPase Era [Kocuria palustris]MCM3331911.1 GTPase Era [Kocuria palustris]